MVEFGPCIVLIQPNSLCVIQVITRIHVKSFEKTQLSAQNFVDFRATKLVSLLSNMRFEQFFFGYSRLFARIGMHPVTGLSSRTI